MDWKREKKLALSLYILEEGENKAYEKVRDAMDAYSKGDVAAASEKALIAALDSRNWMLMGTALSLQGLHEAAIFCYDQAADGIDPHPHYYAVGDYLALDERDLATESLRRALHVAEQTTEYEALEKTIYQLLGEIES